MISLIFDEAFCEDFPRKLWSQEVSGAGARRCERQRWPHGERPKQMPSGAPATASGALSGSALEPLLLGIARKYWEFLGFPTFYDAFY